MRMDETLCEVVCVKSVQSETTANIPAGVVSAFAASAFAVVVAAVVANVQISCFCQAQPLRRIPASQAHDERERALRKSKERLRPGGHRNMSESGNGRAASFLFRELASLNFKCIA